ncbi:O-antigen ligase family protein [Colwelliaceae bacterium BS250]
MSTDVLANKSSPALLNNSYTHKIIFYTFLLLLFWLPIPLGSNRPWAWAIMEVIACLLFIAIIYSHSFASIKRQCKPYLPLLIGLAVFQLFQLIQLIELPIALLNIISPNTVLIKQLVSPDIQWASIALDPTQALIASIKSFSYLLILLCTIILVNNFKRLKLLLLTIIVTGTWQAFYGSLQALNGDEYSYFMQLKNSTMASGSFVYKNHFANFLILCLSIGIGYLVATINTNKQHVLNPQHKFKKLLVIITSEKFAVRVALAIMVIAIVLSRSRMGNAAFFIAMTTTGLLALWLLKHKSKSLVVLVVSLILIDTLILGAWFGLDKVKQRIEQTNITTEARVDINEYSFELIKLFPETGVGGGGFYSSFPTTQGSDLNAYFDHAHNDYFQFAIEYGLPASIWLGFFVLLSLYHALKAMQERRSSVMQGLGFSAVMAIIGMLIHISVDFQLQAPANAAYFHVILALAWFSRFGLKAKSKSQLKNKPKTEHITEPRPEPRTNVQTHS